jgi:hypothetical protein
MGRNRARAAALGGRGRAGRNLIAFGGAGFASVLIANDLVDEYQFYVNPVALREGLSIFKERGIDSDLQLLEAEAYACGIVVNRYAPRGRAPTEAHAPPTSKIGLHLNGASRRLPPYSKRGRHPTS